MDSLSEEERRDFFKGDLFAGVAASQTTIGPGRLTTRLGFTHLRSNLPHGNQDDGSQRRLREALERRA